MVKKTTKKTTRDSSGNHSKKDFLVVGLGASAGGVKALQEFFATMPPNSGMAFVAILHLSPEHESSLPQILQAQTAMKVTQVKKEVKVEPNNVYVIPPNQQLEMVDGVIRPAKVERPHGHRIAIDVFFRTLAEAYEKNAVCVVLSGTGSDGTLGLKRIKESNGFAIVQEPEDAEYDAMPRSAINTQLADWVLPVRQMPEKLIHFRESSERLHLTNGADAEKVAEEINADESLREILTILRVRTGHDFANYKTPTLVRRVARHIQIHELEDLPAYLNFLRQKPDEVHSLLKNLLINVTNFFRDKAAFESLRREVVPKIFDGKTGKDTVRVWSCGCASGEEAYSLAMILQEYADTLPDPPKFQVFASDVDEEALSEAREHRYAQSIETDVSNERLKRFFVREGAFYRVKKELRESVLFAPHNVLRDPPFSRLDLIVCRNLLIYLNRDTQERVLQIFHFALNNGGFLFLGSSETADGAPSLFAAVDKKQRVYSRRHAALNQTSLPMMPVVGRWDVRIPGIRPTATLERSTTLGAIYYKLLESYAPSSVLVNQDFDIAYLSETAGKFLHFVGGEPSKNILKAVNPALLPDLRAALFTAQRDRQSAEFLNAHVVIGGEPLAVNTVVRVVGDDSEAEDFFLVIFEERADYSQSAEHDGKKIAQKDDAMESVVRRLEEDLQRTKEHLRFTIEQHETAIEEAKAANEELQAINEELRSASEELETSKEELQSVNEELTTVNHEFKEKVDEAAKVNSDLSNLVSSTDIATIFLDKNLSIKRFTPPVEQLFNITQHDIGRPLEHFTHHLSFDRLTAEASKVLRSLKPFERETEDHEGNVYLARFLPYRTIDDRIDGVVLNFIDITERKRAETRWREYEDRFRAFVTANSDAVYSMNADWSEMRFLKGKNFLPDIEHPNRNWLETYILPADHARVLKVIKNAVRRKTIFELEHGVIRVDGTTGWTFSRAIPLLDEKGEIVEWFGTASDITERKKVEAVLRESEEKYRVLFDSIEEGFCTIEVLFDKKGKAIDYRFLTVNAAFERQTGLKNAVGKTIRELAPAHEEFWFKTYGRVAKTGEETRFEHEASALGKFYDVYAFRIGNLPENRVAILFYDVSARKLAEKAESFQVQLLNSVEQSVIATDLDGTITFWNAYAEKLFGWTAAETVGRNIVEITTPQMSQAEAQEIMKQVRGGKGWQGEFTVQRRDGTTFPAQVYNSPIYDERGDLIGIVGVSIDITKRKQAENALRQSEETLRLATEAADAYSWEFDIKTETYRFSRNAPKILGVARKNLPVTVEDTFKLVHPDDKATIEKLLKNAARTGEGFTLDFRTVTQKGKTVWLAVQSTIVKDAKGKPERIVGIAQNITTRKLAEEMLRESEERMRIAIEAGELATWEWDIPNDRVYWNKRHFELFGMKPTPTKPVKPEDFLYHVYQDDREWVAERLNRAVEKKIPFEAEFRADVERDGIRWMNGYGRVIETDKAGKATRMSGVMFDITTRKQAEESLRKSEEQLHMILESTKDYTIITFDLNNVVTRWNSGAEKIFGYAPKEIIGQSGDILFTPEDRAAGVPAKELQTALKKGRAEDERWHLRRDGSRFFASGVMQPLKDGKVEGFVKIARDQTERLTVENALREQETLRRLVVGQEDERRRIARDLHDHLGQQMTALRLKLDTVQKMSDDEEISLEIDEAQNIAARLDADVDFIAWELRPAALDDLGLRVTLANFLREWSHHTKIESEFHTEGIGKKRLSFETETNLYRIAQEALNNIYKHAQAKNVSVILEKRKDVFNLIIEDDGIGFNVKDKNTRNKGIGLIGMQERARTLGGDVEIESKKGDGTTIFARVPAKYAE